MNGEQNAAVFVTINGVLSAATVGVGLRAPLQTEGGVNDAKSFGAL